MVKKIRLFSSGGGPEYRVGSLQAGGGIFDGIGPDLGRLTVG